MIQDIKPHHGIGPLLFGMKRPDIEHHLGAPDAVFKDEDHNPVLVYNDQMLQLTLYLEEDLRLGYMICAHPDVALYGEKIIGKPAADVLGSLPQKVFPAWERDVQECLTRHFSEAQWLILQEEFGRVVKVELGAEINSKDEMVWKFK